MLGSILLLLSLFSFEEKTQPQLAQHPPAFHLEIKVEKDNFCIAEPINVVAKFYNNSNKKVKGYYYLDMYWGGLGISHRKVGEDFIAYIPYWGRRDCIALSPVDFPAHTKLETSNRLLYDGRNKQYVLSEPGEYEIKAIFSVQVKGHYETYQSNIVKIQVVKPHKQDQMAITALQDPDLALLIEGLDTYWATETQIETGLAKAATFLEQYGQSRYAPFVRKQVKETVLSAVTIKKLAGEKLSPKLEEIYIKYGLEKQEKSQ